MSKPIFDMYGNELKVGDLIMLTEKAGCRESRPSIIFKEIKGFDRGMITFAGTWRDINIRPKSSEIRKVSGAFVEAWKSGELFKML